MKLLHDPATASRRDFAGRLVAPPAGRVRWHRLVTISSDSQDQAW
jgi:hypothetical protein